MPSSSELVRITSSQRQPAAQVLARAFQDDPLMKFVAPNNERRAHYVSWLMGTVMTYSVLYGEAYATPNLEGVACWLPPGHTTLILWRLLRTGMAAVRFHLGAAETRRCLANMQYTEKMHHQAVQEPHWYLWALGVEPACQRLGTGGKLMTPVLERASQSRVCCYLETHNSRNLPFYKKYGFEVVGDDVIPERGLQVWAMVRKP
jgi:ribosomal protein S18 acetylase RimI-like enzyme